MTVEEKIKYYRRQWKNRVAHKSMYDSYDFCPGTFDLQFIRGMPSYQALHTKIGIAFHEFVPDFFRDIKASELILLEEYQEIKEYFLSVVPLNAPPILRDLMQKFGIYQAKRYYETCLMQDDPIVLFFPVETELELQCEVFYDDKKYKLGGTIDALFNYFDPKTDMIEGYCISEWKTGRTNRYTKIRRANAHYKELVDNTFQLEWLAERQEIYNPRLDTGMFWDEAKKTGEFIYIDGGMYGPFIGQSRKAMFRAIDKILLKGEEGMTELDYKVSKWTCPYCSYNELCEVRRKRNVALVRQQ